MPDIRKIEYIPCIVVLAGLPFSGKTTLGAALAEQSNLVLCDVDTARYEGKEISVSRGTEEDEKQAMLEAYERNHQVARHFLQNKTPVILTATYSRPQYHLMLKKLQEKLTLPLAFFMLERANEEISACIVERDKSSSFSNIRTMEDYLSVKNRYIECRQFDCKRIETGDGLMEDNLAEIKQTLSSLENR